MEPREYLKQMTKRRLIKNDTKIPQAYETIRGTIILKPGEQTEIDEVIEVRVDESKLPKESDLNEDIQALKEQLAEKDKQLEILVGENNKYIQQLATQKTNNRKLATENKKLTEQIKKLEPSNGSGE